MVKPRFTKNKQIVRDLQGETIKNRFKGHLGELRYFGLPSDEMKDNIDWNSFLTHVTAVERGDPPDYWKKHHQLMLTAFKEGILGKTVMLRGDIDIIIQNGKDEAGNNIDYPYDIISLDYSGGLLYRDNSGKQYRLKAVRKLIEEQATHKKPYLLFISTNLDNCDDSEIKKTFENINTELARAGYNANKVINAYLKHAKDEARLKIYIPYFINQVASTINYNCVTEDIIFYLGNRNTHMMNFRFHLTYDPRTTAPRFPRERLSQIINSPMIEISDGVIKKVSLGLPKLTRS
jgi:hypothetical protein